MNPDTIKKFSRIRVRKAFTQVVTLSHNRKQPDIEFLVSRLSTKTYIFVASWGEFRPSIEDIVVLTSLPLFGDNHVIMMVLKGEDKKKN